MKTVTVRVAVAICESGEYTAYGSSNRNEAEVMERVDDSTVTCPVGHVWLTATVIIPEVQEVAASVEKVP